MRRHLVAYDGKEQAEYAFEWYLDNINRPGDEVVILFCSQFVLNIGLPGAAANLEQISKKVQEALKKAEEVKARANEKLKAKGIRGYVIVKSGMKPADAILQAVSEENVSHIIMGTRELKSIDRVFMGSVSTTVLNNAKVAVTIVKRPH